MLRGVTHGLGHGELAFEICPGLLPFGSHLLPFSALGRDLLCVTLDHGTAGSTVRRQTDHMRTLHRDEMQSFRENEDTAIAIHGRQIQSIDEREKEALEALA